MKEDQKRKNFYAMQKSSTAWLTKTFARYVCNYQEFSKSDKRVFENYTCIDQTGKAYLICIIFNVQEEENLCAWYTYQQVNF